MKSKGGAKCMDKLKKYRYYKITTMSCKVKKKTPKCVITVGSKLESGDDEYWITVPVLGRSGGLRY